MDYLKIVIGGVAATAVMTLFMLIAPFIHLPAVNAGTLLGALFGGNLVAGWALHFAIGIMFAYLYVLFANEALPVVSDVARGALYGLIVFVFSEMVFTVVNLTGALSEEMKALMAQAVFTNLIGHFAYGFILGGYIKGYHSDILDWEQKDYFWRFKKPKSA
jgi:hypothetical protein